MRREQTNDSRTGRNPPQPTGFARAGKRLSAWAGNLLVSAVIVVVALTFGREVLNWWYADGQVEVKYEPVEDVTGPLLVGDDDLEHFLQFGDAPLVFGTSRLAGDKDAVFTALLASCRRIAHAGRQLGREPGPAEQNMLAHTANLEPVDAEPGVWQIYQLDGPIPMVLAVTDSTATASGREVARSPRRVLSWGLALPVTESDWTLFTCSAANAAAATLPSLSLLPEPTDSLRTMLLRTEDGGALIGLAGPGDIKAWQEYFDHWFAEQDWKAVSRWRREGNSWQARYGDAKLGWIHVQMSADGRFVRGMLTVAPPGDEPH